MLRGTFDSSLFVRRCLGIHTPHPLVFNSFRQYASLQKGASSLEDKPLSVEDLKVCPEIRNALQKFKFTNMTLVQQKAIPVVLDENDERDLLVQSKTGSGKTLAFLIPIVDRVVSLRNKGMRSGKVKAIILSPTRELAFQTNDVLQSLTSSGQISLSTYLMIGGTNVTNESKQLVKWFSSARNVPDVIIATPGRLLMQLNNFPEFSGINDNLQYLVLDEADTLIDQGFSEEIKDIATFLPQTRKTLFFSATMKRKASELAQGIMKHDRFFLENKESTSIPSLKQRYLEVPKGCTKWASIIRLILDNPDKKMIIFFEQKKMVDMFSEVLKLFHVRHIPLHGGVAQASRTNRFQSFMKSSFEKLLVCTDVAARGLDFPNVEVVIQGDLPSNSQDFSTYFHRSGRTARAGKPGIALIPLTTDELRFVLPVMNAQLRNQYKDDTTMEPLESERCHFAPEGVKSIQDSISDFCDKDPGFRVEARLSSSSFSSINLPKINMLYLGDLRHFDRENIQNLLHEEYAANLGISKSNLVPRKSRAGGDSWGNHSNSRYGGSGGGYRQSTSSYGGGNSYRQSYGDRSSSYADGSSSYGRGGKSYSSYGDRNDRSSSYGDRSSSYGDRSSSYGDRNDRSSSYGRREPSGYGQRLFGDGNRSGVPQGRGRESSFSERSSSSSNKEYRKPSKWSDSLDDDDDFDFSFTKKK
ncbi:ATP-dependent RNA helicase DDX [Acrasis kona]|uniref:ATP-dependent RNA helicase n=1 Tax=Acrasis kona TaxID=1008807 RepID=A0AAW2ZCX4_9EUKA